MQLKKVKNKRNSVYALILAFVSLLLVGLMVKSNGGSNESGTSKLKNDIEVPTAVVSKYSIYDMIKNDWTYYI